MLSPEQSLQFQKVQGSHQLPIDPLNKPHEKNLFDISKLGIDTDKWKYTLTEEDIQDIKMEGLAEHQPQKKRQMVEKEDQQKKSVQTKPVIVNWEKEETAKTQHKTEVAHHARNTS